MAELKVPILVDWDSIKDRLAEGNIVEVVRCEKCIYWGEKAYPSTLSSVLHPCRWWPISTTPLDYCGHGKRRAEDDSENSD